MLSLSEWHARALCDYWWALCMYPSLQVNTKMAKVNDADLWHGQQSSSIDYAPRRHVREK